MVLFYFRFVLELYTKGNTTTKQIQSVIDSTETLCHSTASNLQHLFNNVLNSLPPTVAIGENPHISSFQEALVGSATMFQGVHTEHLRLRNLTSQGLVMPISFKIGSRKDINTDGSTTEVSVYAQYISIIDTLVNKYTDVTKTTAVKGSSDTLRLFEDTTTYQRSEFYKDNPNALKLILYHDDIEVGNCLGSRAGVHKLTMFYISVHGQTTGKLNRIHLVLVCYATDIKTHGYVEILKPLLADLHTLNVGSIIPGRRQKLFARLEHVIGDNLAANQILGLICSFKAGYHCRFCYVNGADYRNVPPSRDHLKRSATSHQFDVELLTFGEHTYKHTGVKHACILDELPYFSCIDSTVPDIM